MIKKIIYIGYMPLTEKVINDFYIEDALLHNYNIEYWDLSHLIFPDIFYKEKSNLSYEFIFKNLDQVKSRLKYLDIDKSLFILNFTYRFNVVKIFFLLTQYNCKTGYFARGALPTIKSNNLEFSLRLISFMSNPKKMFYFLKNKLAQIIVKTGLVKPYTIVFNAGFRGTDTIGYNFINKTSSNFVNINYFDFDDFLSTKLSLRFIAEKYCVFHDEYLPLHPDFSMLGIKTVNSDLYYIELNNFFDLIERKFKVKVVIAAHPKAEKYKTSDMFNNRQVFFGKISSLIKFSEFSILHGSSSVSYSILNVKPCVFITLNSIKINMPTYNRIIRSFADILGQPYININTVSSSDLLIIPVNTIKYDSYKYNYLTSKESENQSSKEIFFQKLLSYD
mgnify:CR=1 FL=1